MSLARLRLSVPRLICRSFASGPSRPLESAQPPTQETPRQRTAEDFLAMLSTPPDSQSSDYSLEGGAAALRRERYAQAADDKYTRPLYPPGQTDQVYHLHVKSTNNNTIITLTDPQGGALKGGSASGGTVGFKGVGKSGMSLWFINVAVMNRSNRLRGGVPVRASDL